MKHFKQLRWYFFSVCLLGAPLIFVSCSDDEESEMLLPVAERIVGVWTVQETQAVGFTVPGDGSTVTFNACVNDTCDGSDFLASDESTGTLTYELNTDGTVLIIVDNDPDVGGAYSGEWTVSEFTNNSITLSADSFLGSVVIKMTK